MLLQLRAEWLSNVAFAHNIQRMPGRLQQKLHAPHVHHCTSRLICAVVFHSCAHALHASAKADRSVWRMQSPLRLSIADWKFYFNRLIPNVDEVLGLFTELSKFLSCKYLVANFAVGPPSESIRCDVIVVLTDRLQRRKREDGVLCGVELAQ